MEFIVKSFEKFPYVCDKHDNIWKYTERGYFIKVTPWDPGEDRRVNRYEIEELIKKGKLTQYSHKQKIFEKINKRWDEIEFNWEYNGDQFLVSLQSVNGTDFMKAPIHKFAHTYTDQLGKEHLYYKEYRLTFFHGKIYWANAYHYWPQVQLYNFESIDKEPCVDGYYFIWTKANHLRPIYSVNKGEYI